jgi:hypothetical protein
VTKRRHANSTAAATTAERVGRDAADDALDLVAEVVDRCRSRVGLRL